MTRTEAKELLIQLGIAEPTEEQITSYLNQVNGEVKSEKDRADKLKADADKATELQKQLEEINSKGLSDVEKANKAVETARGNQPWRKEYMTLGMMLDCLSGDDEMGTSL